MVVALGTPQGNCARARRQRRIEALPPAQSARGATTRTTNRGRLVLGGLVRFSLRHRLFGAAVHVAAERGTIETRVIC